MKYSEILSLIAAVLKVGQTRMEAYQAFLAEYPDMSTDWASFKRVYPDAVKIANRYNTHRSL